MSILIKHLGCVDYLAAWRAMREFTASRNAATPDELWVLEHPPVYTLGVAAKPEHLPRTDNGITVIKTDRGGQITYHGPGQVVVYLLLDVRRRGLGVRRVVRLMEQAVMDLLAAHNITSESRADAPGVYVGDAKIAALGLRIRNGCCYHGLALNVDMDLQPFTVINPCGYAGLAVTQTRVEGVRQTADVLSSNLAARLANLLAGAGREARNDYA